MYFLGDTHGSSYFFNKFIQSDEKYCVQLGDFGFIWAKRDIKHNKFLDHFARKYSDKYIFTILGNHENYDAIEELPDCEMFGAQCKKIRDNIYAVKRGEILSIDEIDMLCIGGANSIDVKWREPHISWWPQENIMDKDVQNALDNGFNRPFDIVCSHALPQFVIDRNFNYVISTASEFALEKIYYDLKENRVSIPLWLGGHMHESVEYEHFGTKFKILAEGEGFIYHKTDIKPQL